jgi:hypothetical protein
MKEGLASFDERVIEVIIEATSVIEATGREVEVTHCELAQTGHSELAPTGDK